MNIAEIAQQVDKEMQGTSIDKAYVTDLTEFLRRCLANIMAEQNNAEQDAAPVAWMYEYSYDLNGDKQGNWPVEMQTQVSFSVTKPDGVATKLYTEAQLIAMQQKTVEACAVVCDRQHDRALTSQGAHRADCCAKAIRNGEWRNFS